MILSKSHESTHIATLKSHPTLFMLNSLQEYAGSQLEGFESDCQVHSHSDTTAPSTPQVLPSASHGATAAAIITSSSAAAADATACATPPPPTTAVPVVSACATVDISVHKLGGWLHALFLLPSLSAHTLAIEVGRGRSRPTQANRLAAAKIERACSRKRSASAAHKMQEGAMKQEVAQM